MYACVTLHRYERQWHHSWCRGSARCAHLQPHQLSVVRILSGRLSCLSSSHTHALWLKFESFMSSPWPSMCVRSLHLDLPSLLLALPFAPFPLPQLHEVYRKPAQLLQRGCGHLWRPLPLHTTTFRCETRAKYQRSTIESENWEPPQIDMPFNKIYDRINHLILSVPSQKQMIRDVGNIELCELLETEPRSESAIHQVYDGFRSTSWRKDELTDIDMVKSRETGNTSRPTNRRRSARKSFSKESMTDSYEMKHSVIEWLKMVETEDVCRQWDALADEDHTHHLTPHYIVITRIIGGFVQTRQIPILCQWKHRSDFKQALSTLQQLKQKEGVLQTSTNSRRNQQWAQSSSSSSWWSWQGSWWTPYSYESHDGDEPSTDRTGWLVVQVFGRILQGMIFLKSITLLQMDRLQLTAVCCTDGCVNTTPQMTCFRGAKVCTKWLQEKVTINSNSLTTSWNWEQVTRWNWDQDETGTKSGKIKNWPWMRGDNAWRGHQWQHVHKLSMIAWCTMRTPMTTWPLSLISTMTEHERASSCFCLSCFSAHFVTSCAQRTVAQAMSLSFHPHGHVHVSVSLRFALTFHFTHFLPHSFHFTPPALEVRRTTTCCALRTKRVCDLSDEFLLSTGYEPKAHDFYETTVEPYVQLLDSPPLFSNKVSSADPDYDDAALEDMLREAHRVHVHHSLREDLSVSLSSSSTSDRTERPVGDRTGRPVEQRNQEAQIRKKSKFLQNAKARISQHEFQAARAEEEQTTPSRTTIAAKFGITWSSPEKTHWNGRIKEVSEFCIRHCGKTKIRRGSETLYWNFLDEYRNCKMK